MNPFNSGVHFDPLRDIHEFHAKFGLEQNNAKVLVAPEIPDGLTPIQQDEWNRKHHGMMTAEEWNLRHKRLTDENDEYMIAVAEGSTPESDEEALDALVDLMYIGLGTAYRRGWDFAEAWKRVHAKNMEKERGNPSNSLYGSGFDIVKPEGWTPPTHADLVR